MVKPASRLWILLLHCQMLFAAPAAQQLAIGDWVLRKGTSAESYLISNFGNGQFSHIGIVIETEPKIRILHATTNDSPQYPNQVIVSSWDEFTDPKLALNYAVARANFLTPAQQQRISQLVQQQLGQTFVLAARHKPHLYCTTIIADAIQAVSPDASFEWSFLDQPLLRGDYLHPDAFAIQDIYWVIQPTAPAQPPPSSQKLAQHH